MGIRRKSRELIVQVIYALEYAEKDPYLSHIDYLNKYQEVLSDLSIENRTEKDDNIYILAEDTLKKLIEHLDEIDEIIKKHIKLNKFGKVGILEIIIMRLSVYEMLYEKIPPAVCISESVDIAKRFCAEKSPSLVNAILDKIKEIELGIKKTEF